MLPFLNLFTHPVSVSAATVGVIVIYPFLQDAGAAWHGPRRYCLPMPAGFHRFGFLRPFLLPLLSPPISTSALAAAPAPTPTPIATIPGASTNIAYIALNRGA
jgi:hypothetical protein